MMHVEFRTIVPPQEQQPKIDYNSRILLLGSCFVENIAKKLQYYKFNCLENPFGILFHPGAIARLLKRLESKEAFTEADLFHSDGRWHTFAAHSRMSGADMEKVLTDLNSALNETAAYLESASHIIITLGSAWGYRERSSGNIVANCHKQPGNNFTKELTEVNDELHSIAKIIKSINPKTRLIFTVSPVRHLKDGFIGNQRSKAQLITAVHQLISHEESIAYFPSYEIVMDELRDYRFFKEDMIHPNETAINYIWERFGKIWTDPQAEEIMERVESIQKDLSHRSFDENSGSYQKFKKKLQEKIMSLQKECPNISF
ncbi:MAG TPA: GSCFA domain-containing protein [Salinimicrobium sp.]|nr:GSCFA domain-containing protein [Salinimicrobium sp.]